MLFLLLRLVGVIWIIGFILLAAMATSSYLYSTEDQSSAHPALAIAPAHVADLADRPHVE